MGWNGSTAPVDFCQQRSCADTRLVWPLSSINNSQGGRRKKKKQTTRIEQRLGLAGGLADAKRCGSDHQFSQYQALHRQGYIIAPGGSQRSPPFIMTTRTSLRFSSNVSEKRQKRKKKKWRKLLELCGCQCCTCTGPKEDIETRGLKTYDISNRAI